MSDRDLAQALNDPLDALGRLIDGYQTTAVLHAAIDLELPDHLDAAPASCAQLAAATGVEADKLQRLLAVLAGLELCSIDATGRYLLTSAGTALTRRSNSGLRQRLLLSATHYAPVWQQLAPALGDDTTAFERLHGCSPWQYRQQHAKVDALFNDWLRCETGRITELIAPQLDLTGVGRVADIGGGTGALLNALLDLHPALEATLFDQAHVIEQAEQQWRTQSRARVPTTVAGDFMQAVPVRADLYLLKSILHDWRDEQAVRVLRACRRSMGSGERLLVIERVLPEVPADDLGTHLVDLHMMLVTGGRERSFVQFRELLEQAGFGRIVATPTSTVFTLIEATCP